MNWESNITCTLSDQRIPHPYKKMQTMFKFTNNILEDMFFNASDCRDLQKKAFLIQCRFIQIK